MHIAFCSDVEAFKDDHLRDKQWSCRFPGSGWVTCLYQMAADAGMDVASGDIAIANVLSKKWNASDVYVIQDMDSIEATRLLDMGSKSFLITCFEAPLYAPFFYDRVSRVAANFKFRLGFGFSDNCRSDVVVENSPRFGFPSFYLEDVRDVFPWRDRDRDRVVLVAGNKYRSKSFFVPGRVSFIGMLRQLKSKYWRFISPAYRNSLDSTLLDQRLEAVSYFAKKRCFALYGPGWSDLSALPSSWGDRLNDVLNGQYMGLCDDKLDTIRRFKFAICFENMVLPGYVTEKIIDCFVAGTIPLYCGAPDINEIVPENSFIDVRKFSSFEQLDLYISAMDEREALQMIEAGRAYLETAVGRIHSYEGFAASVIALAASC